MKPVQRFSIHSTTKEGTDWISHSLAGLNPGGTPGHGFSRVSQHTVPAPPERGANEEAEGRGVGNARARRMNIHAGGGLPIPSSSSCSACSEYPRGRGPAPPKPNGFSCSVPIGTSHSPSSPSHSRRFPGVHLLTTGEPDLLERTGEPEPVGSRSEVTGSTRSISGATGTAIPNYRTLLVLAPISRWSGCRSWMFLQDLPML